MKIVAHCLASALVLLSTADAQAAVELTLVDQVWIDGQDGTNGEYTDIWAEGDYAYIGSWDTTGVSIFNIADPNNAFYVDRYIAGKTFYDVKVSNGIGYFANDGGDGLHVVDLSNPATPTLITKVTSAEDGFDSIHNISIFGNRLYQTSGGGTTVKVFDITDPNTPTFVRNITTSVSGLHDITALGDRLYTSSFGGSTEIYDISSMSASVAPTLLGSISSGSASHSNWVSDDGNLLASARETGGGGIRLYDISDPSSPVLKSEVYALDLGIDATTPHNPIIVGDTLYVSWYEAGLQVFDISDPNNMVRTGYYDTYPLGANDQDGNWGVYPFLGDDRILLSDYSGGLFIVSTEPGDILGDIDGSGSLDGADWLQFIASHEADLSGLTPEQQFSAGDLDSNGFNDYDDLVLFKGYYEAAYGLEAFEAMIATVPEPASFTLLAASLLGIGYRRRRQG
jgi:choice-of-anchor B domain-containing protein